ncbi:putative RNA-directed DNA polymerase [Helianthus annuus]|nr:putative RNA-directed DNA polymerase [Helianthus annuus]
MNFLSLNIRGVGAVGKAPWCKGLISKFKVDFLGLQETLLVDPVKHDLSSIWGNRDCDVDVVEARGKSGGLISVWNLRKFKKIKTTLDHNFIVTTGNLVEDGSVLNVVNVYAPQKVGEKRVMWERLLAVMQGMMGMWIFIGDFNSVRWDCERKNSKFNNRAARDFNGFIDEACLQEFNMQGSRFTFMTGYGKDAKMSKIDRMLVCQDFFNKWHGACLRALPRELSDHSPLLLTVSDSNYGAKPFKWFNSWLNREGCEDIVRDAWNKVSSEGPTDIVISKKLVAVKVALKNWWRELSKKEGAELECLKNDVRRLELVMETRDLEEDELWVWEESKKELDRMVFLKNKDLKQKSRANWALLGDENSAFFHRCINGRKAANDIPGVLVDGDWISKPQLVKREVLRFYRELFHETNLRRPAFVSDNLKQVPDEKIEDLVAPFSKEEIKEVVLDCGSDKAPGPDGFNFHFIKHFWSLMEEDFMRLFEEFHETGFISKECSLSYITLIAKNKAPMGLKDYRPINLVGVINKVISKVIAARIKIVMGDVISESQSAFLKERFILDGPLVLNEVIGWIKKYDKKAFFLKIDFEKAYDNVNWDFLVSIMTQMGFPDKWCLWIRGGPCISHMLYADDALLMGSWSHYNITMTNRFLRIFHWISGLKINVQKSHIFGLGVSSLEVVSMAEVLGCKVGELPFIYLGIKIGANMSRSVHWGSVIDTVKSRLLSWKAKILSMGGRLTLIKSVLASLPVYYFSLFKAPKEVMEEIVRLMKKFLWVGNRVSKGIHWVSWEVVTRPKKYGGLGISKLCDVNVALLVKWAWRFKSNYEGLWRKVVISIHGGRSKWSFLLVKRSLPGTWKVIVNLLETFRINGQPISRLITCNLGNGDRISFWKDVWFGDTPLFIRWLALFSLERDKECVVSSRVVHDGFQYQMSASWSSNVHTVEGISEKQDVLYMLSQVRLVDSKDRWIWDKKPVVEFSVAAIKDSIRQFPAICPSKVFRWINWVPIKVNMLLWRIDKGRVPTRVELIRRNVGVPSATCPMCNAADESISHVFFSCYVATGVWSMVWSWCKMGAASFPDYESVLKWPNSSSSSAKDKIIGGIFWATSWAIWKERNKVVFQNAEPKVPEVVSLIKSTTFIWLKYRSKITRICWNEWVKNPLYML